MTVAMRFRKSQSFFDFVVGLSMLVLRFVRDLIKYFTKSVHSHLGRGFGPRPLRWSEEVALITGGKLC